MHIYGAAAAIIGKDPNKPTLVCSFVKKENSPNTSPIGLAQKDFSEELNLADPTQVKNACKRFITTLYQVIEMQAKEGKQAVPIIIGTDGRQKYPVKQILDQLIEACKKFIKEKGITINDLLEKVHITKGDFIVSIKNPSTGTAKDIGKEEIVQWYLNEEPKSIEDFDEYNRILAENEADIRAGKAALGQAIGIAYRFGSHNLRALVCKGINPRTNIVTFIPDDPRLQTIPLYNFLSWHPRLRQSARSAMQIFMTKKRHMNIKTPSDPKRRAYVDVLDCIIQDLHNKLPILEDKTVDEYLAEFRQRVE